MLSIFFINPPKFFFKKLLICLPFFCSLSSLKATEFCAPDCSGSKRRELEIKIYDLTKRLEKNENDLGEDLRLLQKKNEEFLESISEIKNDVSSAISKSHETEKALEELSLKTQNSFQDLLSYSPSKEEEKLHTSKTVLEIGGSVSKMEGHIKISHEMNLQESKPNRDKISDVTALHNSFISEEEKESFLPSSNERRRAIRKVSDGNEKSLCGKTCRIL